MLPTLTCAHVDTVLYQHTPVQLRIEDRRIKIEAAVSDLLTVSVLLGTDVSVVSELQ